MRNIFSLLMLTYLPKRFSFFNNKNFQHIVDINPRMTDKDIWDYSIQHGKVILTKDADFYNRSISSVTKPKVIYFQLGNVTLDELHIYFKLNWESILKHLKNASLIIASRDNIKVII